MINYEQKVADTSPAEIGDGLVISIPPSLNDDYLSLLGKYPSLKIFQFKTLLKMLISKAASEILIASPFIEENGIMYIMDDITNAKKGVSIKILSRDIVKADPNDYSSLNKQRAISKLKELYEVNKSSPDADISIRDFGVSISGQGRKSLHYEGIHQKMVIVDRRYSYVGSGELRTASFITNGEAGSIYTGLSAEFWADFFEIFWKRAIDVLRNIQV